MVSRSAVCLAVAFGFAAVALHADSITTRDGGSINGRLVTLDSRGAVVRALSLGKIASLTVGRIR